MSTRPRQRKRAVGEDGAMDHNQSRPAALKSQLQDSDDIHPSNTWSIPPGGEGVNVEAKPGRVIISQTPICAEIQTVVLNVEECLRLQVILLSAVEAATGKENS